MKCVKINGQKEFIISEMEEPKKETNKVLIKVKSCGICGSDIHYWVSGEPKGLVMGHEFAGDVIDPGDRKDLKIGDRVTGLPISPCGECDACKNNNPQYCRLTWSEAVGLSLDNNGGYSEIINVRSDLIKAIPDGVSYDEASMVEPSAVSLHAVSLANIKIGDKVLVIGGGIIGLMAMEFAKLNGASNVTVLETNELRGKKATTIGVADEYYNALDKDIVKTLMDKTNGGFDVVIECCGNSPAVSEAMMCTKNGGTIVLVGVSLTPVTVPLVVSVMGEVTLKGAIAYKEEDFDKCIELIKNKTINVAKYIDDKVSLDDTQKSFERLTSGEDDAVKIILNPEL